MAPASLSVVVGNNPIICKSELTPATKNKIVANTCCLITTIERTLAFMGRSLKNFTWDFRRSALFCWIYLPPSIHCGSLYYACFLLLLFLFSTVTDRSEMSPVEAFGVYDVHGMSFLCLCARASLLCVQCSGER
uniref:Uncharacterized protein n=1 Tax=Octopus bimaculoides TaxID=37653 RepID=A0A0L8GY42_OCTBM